ncbi:sugar phosphate isomerase/epimerase family protein [Tetragenococcus halophilus]|uniref:sugar phosphate isomerase/epimerase family protein n=1 Tax=Tetragenococcus halophilus TaxID=51669 RepID=UPI0015BA44AB|nr:sugar phosphate isomerase/epimerase family protein [Tetragenococcus halophilus]NWO00517.1 sugar phosphate isomerase/epimerase [Tetragenococcus halophilus]
MYNLTMRGHDLSNVDTPEDLALKMQNLGIKNIQLALNISFPEMNTSGYGINPGMGTYFKNLLAKHDIQIGLLSCYSNLIHPDRHKREEILLKFESYLKHANFFGASMVASETGSVIPELGYSEDNFDERVFEELIEVIQRLALKGEEYGSLVAIEAGLNHPLYSIKKTKQLIQAVDSDYLGIILDPTNLITAKNHESMVEVVEEAFAQYGSKICAFHLKDYIVKEDQIIPVSLGKGCIKYQEILKIIEKYTPYCYIVLEETKEQDVLSARELIENFEKQVSE